MREPKSKCCNSPMNINYGGEGTNFYVCDACGEACDPLFGSQPAEKHPTGEEFDLERKIELRIADELEKHRILGVNQALHIASVKLAHDFKKLLAQSDAEWVKKIDGLKGVEQHTGSRFEVIAAQEMGWNDCVQEQNAKIDGILCESSK